jgi:hypothetical protein
MGLAGKMAADLGADAQGDAADPARSEQHRHRHRLSADDDSAVRLRALARRHQGLVAVVDEDVSADSAALIGAFRLSPISW